jgi:hypothetical protein
LNYKANNELAGIWKQATVMFCDSTLNLPGQPEDIKEKD